MSSAATALQLAITAILAADTALVALIGSPRRILDDVPPGTPLPYILFAPLVTRDWSTGSDTGSEHTVTLVVWTHATARRSAHEIADRLRQLLHDQPLSLTGHRLVNLRFTASENRRARDGRHVRATLTFRAVTEPL